MKEKDLKKLSKLNDKYYSQYDCRKTWDEMEEKMERRITIGIKIFLVLFLALLLIIAYFILN